MTRNEFTAWVEQGPVLLDGATGTCLQKMGMPRGAATELWVEQNPQALLELQSAYVQAGSRILYAPTFQATPVALEKENRAADTERLNGWLVRLSRQAAGGAAYVAGDMTTMAGVLDAWDTACYDTMVEAYRRQIVGLLDGGADLLVAETLLYEQEAEAVLQAAALEGADVPVLCSFTMELSGSFFSGRDAGPVLRSLEELGAAAVGFNCVAAGEGLDALVSRLRRFVTVPLISKPNAGNPTVGGDGQVNYPMAAETFAALQLQAGRQGAALLGGCCGTSPEFIRAMARQLSAEA